MSSFTGLSSLPKGPGQLADESHALPGPHRKVFTVLAEHVRERRAERVHVETPVRSEITRATRWRRPLTSPVSRSSVAEVRVAKAWSSRPFKFTRTVRVAPSKA